MITSQSQRTASKRRPLTQTQKNGLRQRKAYSDWKEVIESRNFSPIRDLSVKKNTAMLLENQLRWINEAATNTGIFGANNGVTAGSIGNTDSYATGDFRMPRILLPMVRRIYPALMSNETVGVQPMPGPVAMAFAIRYRYLRGANANGDSAVNHVHDTDGTPKGIKGVNTTVTLQVDTTKLATLTTTNTVEGSLILVGDGTTYPTAITVDVHKDAAGQLTVSKTYTSKNPDGTEYSRVQGFGYLFTGSGTVSGDNTVFTTKPVGAQSNTSFDTIQGSEMGYQKLDTRYTGRADARLGEKLANGRWQFRPEDTGIAAHMQQFEATGAVSRTTFGFEKQAVEAGTRRLSTSWTLETEEDLKNTNGIDIDTEATQQMSYELQAEIDREMTVRMLYSCLKHNEWSLWTGALADARWMGERARAFYQHLIKMSLRMRVRNRRGAANFILCTPDVAALLETLDEFIAMPVASNVTTNNGNSAAAGSLGNGRFNVYIDDRTPVYSGDDYGADYNNMFETTSDFKMPNYCMLGYKGTDTYDAGIIYCPYIPIMIQTATDPYSFEPQVGLMTRYGVMDNIFGSWLYYHVIIIDNFSQPGLDSSVAPNYPAGYVTATQATKDFSSANMYALPVNDTSKA